VVVEGTMTFALGPRGTSFDGPTAA
jgi:hypothetical protein